MKTSEDIKMVVAKAPAAVVTAATTYNGVAVGSAAGIDTRGKGVALAQIVLGAVAASGGAVYTFAASALASNPAADIEAITGSATIATADSNTVVAMSLEISAMPAGKPYLYIKRVQATTDSVLDGIVVLLTDGQVQPAGLTLAVEVES